MERHTDGIDRLTGIQNAWKNKHRDRRVNLWRDGLKDGQTEGQMNRRVDRQMIEPKDG
jgi:hypothetical protein